MAAFSYSAINASGLELTGELHAPDLAGAREQLRVRGLLANSLDELAASGDDSARNVFKKVKPKTLQIFSRQFATMIEAGLNVVAALVILEQQTDDPYFAMVVKELRADVEGGLLLSQAMHRHPKIFDRLFVSMVEAGEAAGILDEVLDRVAYQIEKSTQIKRRVKGAMLYPTMVLIFATLVLTGLLMFLVPVFVKIFGPARRPASDAHAVRRDRVGHPSHQVLHHLPRRRSDDLWSEEVQEDRSGPAEVGPHQAQDPDEDRGRSSSRSRWPASRGRSRHSSRPAWTSSRPSRSRGRPPVTG